MTIDNQGEPITPEMQKQIDREQEMLAKGRVRAEKRRKQLEKRQGLSETKSSKLQAEQVQQAVMGAVMAFVVEAGHSSKSQWIEPVMPVDPDLIAITALKICQDSAAQVLRSQNVFHRAGMAMEALTREAYMRQTRAGTRLMTALKKTLFPTVDQLKYMGKFRKGDKQEDDYLEWQLTHAERVMAEADRRFPEWEAAFEEWSDDKYKAVGSFLIACVMRGCDLFEEKMLYVEKNGKPSPHPVGHIAMTEFGKQQLADGNQLIDGLFPMFTPIVGVPPNDWDAKSLNRGGPYHDPAVGKLVPLVKHATGEQKDEITKRVNNGEMKHCLDAINSLQKVPLTINKTVLDCIDWVVETENYKKLGDFPDLDRPDDLEEIDNEIWVKYEKSQKAQWYRDRVRVQQEQQEIDANELNLNNHRKQARELLAYADEGLDKFWLPHQFDFRGRVYCTPDFNFQKNDYIRALFMFYNKTAITPENDEFLYLQLANTWGNRIDKKSYEDRLEWVGDNIQDITKTGADFRTNFDFWMQADDPFQFVAACRESYLYNEARVAGEVYYSGLPVALDATNSGYQHYAAASLNEHDGYWVNLVDPDEGKIEPRDLYIVCRDAALAIIPSDIETMEREITTGIRLNENEQGQIEEITLDEDELDKVSRRKAAAETLLSLKHDDGGDGLTRKVAKGPVMTWAYSSEDWGIAKALRKSYFDKFTKQVQDPAHPRTEHPYGEDCGYIASFYLANLLVRAIKATVRSAEQGMSFFQSCSDALKAENKHFQWTTKIGFPAFQEYLNHEKDPNKIRLFWWGGSYANRTVEKRSNTRVYTDEVKGTKSRNAIAPNIIHAMDATHLMSTVLGCAEIGVTDLMCVHDSFATTIGNAAKLRNVVRREFHDQYADYSLYEDIRRQTAARLADGGQNLPAIPEDGSLELTKVKRAKYPFS